MNPSFRERVTERAGRRCEYCRIPAEYVEESFCIDHVIAKKHHGPTSLENLAYSCYWCNAYKGDNLSGFDPNTSSVIRLFNPRVDIWSMHFAWHGSAIFH